MALDRKKRQTNGRGRTKLTIAGNGCGCVLHDRASARGLGAILATSASAFNVLKTIGAAYSVSDEQSKFGWESHGKKAAVTWP